MVTESIIPLITEKYSSYQQKKKIAAVKKDDDLSTLDIEVSLKSVKDVELLGYVIIRMENIFYQDVTENLKSFHFMRFQKIFLVIKFKLQTILGS